MLRSVAVATLLIMAAAPAAQAAADPPTTDADRELIQRVPDETITYDGLERRIGAFTGLTTVGSNDAYALKADQSGDEKTGWAILFHTENFNSDDASTDFATVRLKGSSAPYSLGHANGLEYYRAPGTDCATSGCFYVPMLKAVGDDQVAVLNENGEVTKLFGARKGDVDKKIASIAYRGDGHWIVGTAGENVPDPDDDTLIRKPYYDATISGDHFALGAKFFVPTTTTFDVGQDIDYDASTDELLVPVWDGQNDVGTATGRKNRIIGVPLGEVTDGTVYTPSRWIDLTVPESAAAKFEIEGIDAKADGDIVVGSNIVHPDGETLIDGIHRIIVDDA
jgi:hypothetical protein